MKRIILVLIVLTLGFSCKSTKKAAHQTAIDTDNTSQVITETSHKAEEITPTVLEEPVVVRTEEVRVMEDKVESEATFEFYVIIGSFSLNANADKYKAEMVNKGFTPTVLISETGLFRVAVEQTHSENQARTVISRIRSQFPEHNDVWLLKRR